MNLQIKFIDMLGGEIICFTNCINDKRRTESIRHGDIFPVLHGEELTSLPAVGMLVADVHPPGNTIVILTFGNQLVERMPFKELSAGIQIESYGKGL